MTSKRFGMMVLWTLALVLPGGLPLLGAYLAYRTARAKPVVGSGQARVSRVSVVGV